MLVRFSTLTKPLPLAPSPYTERGNKADGSTFCKGTSNHGQSRGYEAAFNVKSAFSCLVLVVKVSNPRRQIRDDFDIDIIYLAVRRAVIVFPVSNQMDDLSESQPSLEWGFIPICSFRHLVDTAHAIC